MKAKLIVEDKEFFIEINDPELEKLLKPQKKTGYEKCEEPSDIYFVNSMNHAQICAYNDEDIMYDLANYYSDKTIAENNARVDKLMRQLRRYAVEHRENKIKWCNHKANSFIFYNHVTDELEVAGNDAYQAFGIVYFDSKKTAELAIEKFKDELIWYFTEYKDSL